MLILAICLPFGLTVHKIGKQSPWTTSPPMDANFHHCNSLILGTNVGYEQIGWKKNHTYEMKCLRTKQDVIRSRTKSSETWLAPYLSLSRQKTSTHQVPEPLEVHSASSGSAVWQKPVGRPRRRRWFQGVKKFLTKNNRCYPYRPRKTPYHILTTLKGISRGIK